MACSYLIDERDADGEDEQGKYSGDGTDGPAYAVEYSWVDDYNTICSVEVSSLSKYNHKVAELVRDTIHKVEPAAEIRDVRTPIALNIQKERNIRLMTNSAKNAEWH